MSALPKDAKPKSMRMHAQDEKTRATVYLETVTGPGLTNYMVYAKTGTRLGAIRKVWHVNAAPAPTAWITNPGGTAFHKTPADAIRELARRHQVALRNAVAHATPRPVA